MAEAFRESGKPVFLQDVQRQSLSMARHSYLADWLEMVTGGAQAEDWQEPAGWREAKLNRKVVLYYSTVDALLSHGEQAIEECERVARIASARRNLCFYWLADADTDRILALLGSELQERYRICRDMFQVAPNCCYDETNSIETALQRADVYYGDDVVWLDEFREAGKPVLYRSYDKQWGADHILPQLQHETLALSFMDGVWVGEHYYFAAWLGNCLFRLSKGNDRAEYVSSIPVDNVKTRLGLFCTLVHYEGRLFLIPSQAKDIMVFDLGTRTWQKLPVSREHAWDNTSLFLGAVQQGRILWLLPLSYYAVGRLDLRTLELSYVIGWGEGIASKITNPGSQHFVKGILAGDKLAFVTSQSCHLVLVTTSDAKAKAYELELDGDGYTGMDFDGQNFWLADKKGRLLRWSPQEGLIDNMLDIGFIAVVIYHSGYIWAFPIREDRYVKYEIATGKVVRREHYLPEELRAGLWSLSLQKDEHYIYILPNSSEVMTRLDPVTEEVSVRTIRLVEQDKEKYLQAQFQKNVLGDGEFIDDNEMATWLECCGTMKMDKGLAGLKIFKWVINEAEH